MESSPESTRPSKRVKYEQHDDMIPLTMSGPDIRVPANMNGSLIADDQFYDNSWALTTQLSSPSQVLFNLSEDLNAPWTPTSTATQPAALNLYEATALQTESQRPQTQQLPRLLPAASSVSSEEDVEYEIPRTEETALNEFAISPFTSDGDRLSESGTARFTRPEDGRVDGYIKFHWPKKSQDRRLSQQSVPTSSRPDDDGEHASEHISQAPSDRSNSGEMSLNLAMPATSRMQNGMAMSTTVGLTWEGDRSSPVMAISSRPPQGEFGRMPPMLPTQFGMETTIKMDWIDRRLFEFYIRNWCPGRSVLENTNLWLKDLAPMHTIRGVLHAMQSLVGVYIYDYMPDERIRHRINQRYAMANQYFIQLLNAPESRAVGKGGTVVTMAVLLSMQDIIMTERRLKKPAKPRWLEGFKQAEFFLQQTDPGRRFWKDQGNVQYDPLRISQSIIVGRAVILAQPMMALPDPKTMNPEVEANRFNWLLYGTENDLFEIHGGCGFSKKLLHTMSQVTYCAARLQQEPESTIVPITAKFIMRTLTAMRQWSREGKSWLECKGRPQTIEWVRAGDVKKISSKEHMTDVTAEAWRIAAIIYYQCRLLRLPRNHPDVLVNMEDLAKCIRIMPTSGLHFTAQAPLLPAFFLGLLATKPAHKEISRDWFEPVVNAPVRSSVPPLYEALKRIWGWIDRDVVLEPEPTRLSESLGQRPPWWEHLVRRVLEEEDETLCLT